MSKAGVKFDEVKAMLMKDDEFYLEKLKIHLHFRHKSFRRQ